MLACCPIFNVFAVIFDVFGILSNVLILFFLHFNEVGSRMTTLLMKNQFIFDGLVSTCAFISLVWRDEDFDNVSVFAGFVCYIWTSRSLFWFFVLLSETNLMCLAVDRLRAIVFPTSYKRYAPHTLVFFYIFTFVFAVLNSIPSIFLVEFRNRTCLHVVEHPHTQSFQSYLLFVAYLWCINGYFLHAVIMGICHLKVIKTLHHVRHFKRRTRCKPIAYSLSQSQVSQNSGGPSASQYSKKMGSTTSTKNQSLTRSITIPAIVMWTVFLVTHSYQAIFFLLYAHDVINFRAASVERRLSTLSTIINSACNPLIMVISSPPFRRTLCGYLKSWFSCRRHSTAQIQA